MRFLILIPVITVLQLPSVAQHLQEPKLRAWYPAEKCCNADTSLCQNSGGSYGCLKVGVTKYCVVRNEEPACTKECWDNAHFGGIPFPYKSRSTFGLQNKHLCMCSKTDAKDKNAGADGYGRDGDAKDCSRAAASEQNGTPKFEADDVQSDGSVAESQLGQT
ncbi:hypothetical protein FKW77_001345 [Venturia effusa]|uniref:Extracellular membrane protein CFEM domain-containing protein n=1 Tax=Venturia effusa TaxID=50376 RepID=A0A517KVT3_9PEZI|nr:hypothetical protein FKW77_001345 [Venturia effusa]